MAKYVKVEQGETAVFMGGGVQLVKDETVRRSANNGASKGAEEDGGGEVRQGMVTAILSGGWDTFTELFMAYPQSAGEAVKRRFLAEMGVRPPASGYAPVLSRQERRAIDSEVNRETAMIVGSPGSAAIVRVLPTEKGKKAREVRKTGKQIAAELREKRREELSRAKDFFQSVAAVVTEYEDKKRDEGALLNKAVGVMKDKSKVLQDAFIAGQSVSSDLRELPTDLEKAVARECVMAERRSGRVWSDDERGNWVMGFLNNQARRTLVETGKHLVEVEQLLKLDELSVADDVEEGEAHERVLLDIPIMDITLAESLGADKGKKGMAFGVQVILGPGNRIMANYLSKREVISATPDTIDTGVYVVPGADLLYQVQMGRFGGKKWRGFINTILGDEQNRLPLAGNLAIGSTTKGGGNDVVIPMLNPQLGQEVLLQVKQAVRMIDRTSKQITESNPLVGYSQDVLPEAATQVTVSKIMSLPNARRITKLAVESVKRVDNSITGVRIVTDDDVQRQESEVIHEDNPKARHVAEVAIKTADQAKSYWKDRRKLVGRIMREDPVNGKAYVEALDRRADEIIAIQQEIDKGIPSAS